MMFDNNYGNDANSYDSPMVGDTIKSGFGVHLNQSVMPFGIVLEHFVPSLILEACQIGVDVVPLQLKQSVKRFHTIL